MTKRERRLALRAALWTFTKRAVFMLVGGVALYQAYLIVMPGSWFLQYKQASVTQTVFEGETVPLDLCRERKTGSIKAEATRTFYRSDSINGPFRTVDQYTYMPNIEDGAQCVTVSIKASRFSHTAGYWKFHTDLAFRVGGYEKTTSYDSSVYQVRARPTNAEIQQDLQGKIDKLQAELDAIKAQTGVTATPTASTQTPAQPVSEPSVARRETPTTSAPPEQSAAPTQPESASRTPAPQPSLIERVLARLTDLTRGVGL